LDGLQVKEEEKPLYSGRKRSKFSDEDIEEIIREVRLKEHNLAYILRKHDMTATTYYRRAEALGYRNLGNGMMYRDGEV
jgi:transposase-like protein